MSQNLVAARTAVVGVDIGGIEQRVEWERDCLVRGGETADKKPLAAGRDRT